MKRSMLFIYLLRFEVTYDGVDNREYFLNEGHGLPHLDLYEMSPALLSYFQEGVAGHILYSIMRFYRNRKSKCIERVSV